MNSCACELPLVGLLTADPLLVIMEDGTVQTLEFANAGLLDRDTFIVGLN